MYVHLTVKWYMHLKFLLNMVVIEELKLNKFEPCHCPDCQDLFRRVGQRVLPDYVDGQVAEFNQNTMDALGSVEDAFLAHAIDATNE